ncbi:MAG: NAD(P)-dependent oxidoreductase [Paracoccaceae bacterium]|nr:NAD(P)-dependent oxidoreductase [Paracoccaceae bacterium]
MTFACDAKKGLAITFRNLPFDKKLNAWQPASKGRPSGDTPLANDTFSPGVVAARLPASAYRANFGDLHPPLDDHEARVAADRCYFCFDAPCTQACPTAIDVPLFIRQISTGTPLAAAQTILSQNILGGMCARVCPTETLCEQACVRETAEGRPVEIGRLQRHATDRAMAAGPQPFTRAAPTGKRVAVVGAGPAGLTAAHRLALLGHEVTLHDGRPKVGGLNEYGIAAYKAPDGFAQAEIDWLLGIGGIRVVAGQRLGEELALDDLRRDFDAVFLAIGLAGVNALEVEGEDRENVRDAVDFIAELRQTADLSGLPVGRDVIVIGGGMTAVDAAVQARLLGAQSVTIVYRRGPEEMGASAYERDLAASKGVRIITHAAPLRVLGNGAVREVEFAYTRPRGDGGLERTDQTFRLLADQVFKAIGQPLEGAPEGLALDGRKIAVSGPGRTSLAGVWAGGDCAAGSKDLTVSAVAQGRDAAMDIHAALMG